MITKHNLKELLKTLGFIDEKDIYTKFFNKKPLKVDFSNQKLIYPENTHHNKDTPNGIIIHERQTCNFSQNENFVVFECIARLLEKGYKPEHIEIEPKWKLGHTQKGGKADILIKDNQGKALIIIECKTADKEHDKAWRHTLQNGGQLFSYVQQVKTTQYGILYSSDFVDGKIKYRNEIITFIDNKVFLEKSPHNAGFQTYKNASSVSEIFNAWKNTYYQDYQTRGFLEQEIAAYSIAKNKYTIRDLVHLDYRDIQKKYHAFATILRKHNVSGRENAFDKLVNLFLCKLVDESKNVLNQSDELKFYWKGATTDNAFDLQDRLELLYQEGMQKFLKEEVTYINDEQVDQAFRFFKNDPDATKETIQKYFKQLKFFTNNDFAFIDVHNEKLFYQNFVVLLEVVRLFQDISLRTNADNQFLGDLFEGFLDQGVKQSEGQFFTPMPIVRFIVSALPLEDIIKQAENTQPKVIDYACGSGHFLNEYAKQLQLFSDDNDVLKKYYQNIYGIEKEYRLSKVAKVSTFMYGQEEVEILYSDALSQNDKIKESSFSVLIANPPYSVKGFLETLPDKDKKNYKLINCIDAKSYATNNTIQSFFIERAKQLLKPGGIAGIILPSSILSNADALHVATRELILKYFNIIAIVAFDTGTFGKTGTNTVTLFLRRREENPASAEHYKNRVNSWFYQTAIDKACVYQDEALLNAYCQHLKYNMVDYKAFLQGDIAALQLYEIFADYQKSFDNLADIKKLKKQKTFKTTTPEEQALELEKRFLNYVKRLEQDKVYYFIMASITPNPVVIVKAPTKSAEIKKFLGYGWSDSKGHEGIKYLASSPGNHSGDIQENLEDIEKRALDNIYNIHHIHTPLYNPNNLFDPEKINSIIRANFKGKTITISDKLQDFVSTARLIDMLDFTPVDFKKIINTMPKENIAINSKWEMVKLGNVCDIKKGKTITQKTAKKGKIKVVAGGVDFAYFHNVTNRPKFTITISASGANAGYLNFWKEEIFASDCTTINPKKNGALINYFVFSMLKSMQSYIFTLARGSAQPHVYPDDLKSIKIPLPPMDIQQKIVAECEAVDKEVTQAKKGIKEAKSAIDEHLNKLNRVAYLKDIFNKVSNHINPRDHNGNVLYVGLENIEANTGNIIGNLQSGYAEIKSTKNKFNVNDILYGKLRPNLNKVVLANISGICSTDIMILRLRDDLFNKLTVLYKNYLLLPIFNNEVLKTVSGQQLPRTSWDKIFNIKIPLPPLEKQKEIIAFCESQEAKIKQAQAIIDHAKDRKNIILQNYL